MNSIRQLLKYKILPLKGTLSTYELLTTNILAAVVGVMCGYIAIGFRFLIRFFQNTAMFNDLSLDPSNPIQHTRGFAIIGVLMVGMYLTWLLVRLFANEAKGHGVPEVMESVLVQKGIIRKRVVAIKALASSICIGFGGSVGREGPIVQIGAAAGSSLAQLFRLRPRLIKVLLGCGAVGGIAGTFNTPIAGVIFGIEIILMEFKTHSFIPLVISAVMAAIVTRTHLGSAPAFIVPTYTLAHPLELIFYLGLGILAGFVGVLVIKTLYGTESIFDKLKIPEWNKPLLGGLILGLIGLYFPQVFGVGYETISLTLAGKATFATLAILLFLKMISTSVTIAAGGSGGVFAPSLFIGAMLGGAYGFVIHAVFPHISAGFGAYALVGMAAVFASTSRASFTAMVILFEMTLDYQIILPLMFACVISDQISVIFTKETIYTKKLTQKGLTVVQDMSINLMEIQHVGNFMNSDVITVKPDMTLRQLQETVLPTGHHTFPVVDEDQKCIGILLSETVRDYIKRGEARLTVKDMLAQPKVLGHKRDTLMYALRKIEKTGEARLVVVDRETRELQGIITSRDIIRSLYLEE